MADAKEEPFPVPILGREVMFRPPTEGQLLVAGRILRKYEQLQELDLEEVDEEQVKGAMGRVSRLLDIIDSMVVNPVDRDWLEQKIVDRELDLSELMEAFRRPDTPPPNRATKRAAVKKSTRARST